MPFKKYRSGGLANSIAKRLGPPTAKLFDKEQPFPHTTNKTNIFARLGKEVSVTSSDDAKATTNIISEDITKKEVNSSTSSILRKRLASVDKTLVTSGSSNIIRLKPSNSER